MAENVEPVIDSQPGSEGNEPASPPEPDGNPEGGSKGENRIPISRAEEMWKRREEKLLSEFRTKEVDPIRKQYEEQNRKLIEGQLSWMKSMGWYSDQPEKPLTRDEINKLITEQTTRARQETVAALYEERIRTGWEQTTSKYPKLASNKRFQSAVLASYAENPQVSLVQHADSIVKELMDVYHTDKLSALKNERESNQAPDRRVVPSGRGVGGGSGDKNEKKKSVADRIVGRLKEIKGE